MASINGIQDLLVAPENIENTNQILANISEYAAEFSSYTDLITRKTEIQVNRAAAGLTAFSALRAALEIQGNAFDGTPIESITIPNRVSRIGAYCFKSCTSLTKVTIES